MNLPEIQSYSLRVEHHSTGIDFDEKQCYDRVFNIKLLNQYVATYYDPELKIGFESENKSGKLIEIEISEVKANLSDRLKTAEDLFNRSNYLFDWIQLKVRNDGKIQSIENKDELTDAWLELKEKLLEEYEGGSVEKYLEKLSSFFPTDAAFRSIFNQYFYFGLLFPGIPLTHGLTWENKRIVRLSPFDNDAFEERLQFIREENNLRHYAVSGTRLADNIMEVNEFAGTISFDMELAMVCHAQIQIVLRQEDFLSRWKFTLEFMDQIKKQNEDVEF